MLTPEQIKGRIKNIAEKKDLRPQEVLQTNPTVHIVDREIISRYQSLEIFVAYVAIQVGLIIPTLRCR